VRTSGAVSAVGAAIAGIQELKYKFAAAAVATATMAVLTAAMAMPRTAAGSGVRAEWQLPISGESRGA
jgi:hypothetical protein